jgi:hypothetical protein
MIWLSTLSDFASILRSPYKSTMSSTGSPTFTPLDGGRNSLVNASTGSPIARYASADDLCVEMKDICIASCDIIALRNLMRSSHKWADFAKLEFWRRLGTGLIQFCATKREFHAYINHFPF